MDRPIAYVQEQGRSTDFLFAQRSTMIAIAKLSQAAFGSGTVVRGLAVTPNSPAALNVLVGIGEIYTLASVDATTYGSLPADTTDQIVQQGLNMAAQTISTPAPTTAGYSINYLIEAQFQSQDTNPVVLPFYNSANPQQPLNGQGGGGATLPTERQGVCVIQAKAGIAATTGTQVTPSVDSGWTALAVVTVANGQVSVGAGNISIPAGVPQITSLLQMMQTDATNYAGLAGGTANAITATLSPAPASYSDYLLVTVRVANTNTGSVSLNVNGLGAVPVIGLGHQVLQGGELLAGGFATFAYSTNYSEAILIKSTGGPLQIAAGTASQHAAQIGQLQAAGATYAQDTGSANTLVASLLPAITSLSSGMKVRIHVAANNTGASTLNLNGLGALPIYGFAGSALQGGELKSGVVAEFCLSDDKTTWVLQNCEFGALQIAPATQSQHAAQLSQVGFQNIAVYEIVGGVQKVSINGGAFTTTGATTFTVPVSGRFKARVWGAGGGSGSGVTSAAATGGAGGGYAEGVITGQTAGASLAITVGAGGTGGSGSGNGTAGGTSSIAALVSCTGGSGGIGSASGAASGTSVSGGTATGGSLNISGQGPASAFSLGGTLVASGGGGTFGTSQSSISIGSATSAIFPGGAGSGGANNNVGVVGANGLVIIEY